MPVTPTLLGNVASSSLLSKPRLDSPETKRHVLVGATADPVRGKYSQGRLLQRTAQLLLAGGPAVAMENEVPSNQRLTPLTLTHRPVVVQSSIRWSLLRVRAWK